MKKFHLYFASLIMVLATVVTLNGFVKSSQAAGIDSTRDCDNTAIIHCGVMTLSELKTKYAKNEAGDLPAIYKHFGVTNFDGFVDGVVWRDGRVTVGNETVATGAMTAARNMPGGAIPGSEAKVINPNVWPAEFISAKPAFVKMVNGKFAYAVLKTCGNPVKATPKLQPTAACKDVTVNAISRTEFEFTGNATVADGAKVSAYVFTVKNSAGTVVKSVTVNSTALSAKSGKVTLPTAGNYSVSLTVKTSLGDKTTSNCVKNFTVSPPPANPTAACKDVTVNAISRTEFEFTGNATVAEGAKVSAYVFTVKNSAGTVVKTVTVDSTALSAKSGTVTLPTAGNYSVSLTVKTSLGDKTDANCVKNFTVSPPPVKPVAVCESLGRTAISRTASTLTANANTSGGATISSYVFTVKDSEGATAETMTVTSTENTATTEEFELEPGTYTASVTVKTSLGDRVDAKCNVNFTVAKPDQVEVCNPETGKNMVVDKGQEGNYKPVGDVACSTVTVCDETTKEIIEVPYKDRDNYKDVDDAACKEVPVEETPKVEGVSVIASTGPADFIVGGAGLSSLAAAGYYFRDSRRRLTDALRKR